MHDEDSRLFQFPHTGKSVVISYKVAKIHCFPNAPCCKTKTDIPMRNLFSDSYDYDRSLMILNISIEQDPEIDLAGSIVAL